MQIYYRKNISDVLNRNTNKMQKREFNPQSLMKKWYTQNGFLHHSINVIERDLLSLICMVILNVQSSDFGLSLFFGVKDLLKPLLVK